MLFVLFEQASSFWEEEKRCKQLDQIKAFSPFLDFFLFFVYPNTKDRGGISVNWEIKKKESMGMKRRKWSNGLHPN